jgi:hypothetical protein
MRKLMVLAAMLALMLAVAAPAFAQDVTVTTGDNTEFNAVAQNIIGSVGDISATQTGTAAAGNGSTLNDSVAVAHVDQSQDVSIVQSNVVGNGWGWVWVF